MNYCFSIQPNIIYAFYVPPLGQQSHRSFASSAKSAKAARAAKTFLSQVITQFKWQQLRLSRVPRPGSVLKQTELVPANRIRSQQDANASAPK